MMQRRVSEINQLFKNLNTHTYIYKTNTYYTHSEFFFTSKVIKKSRKFACILNFNNSHSRINFKENEMRNCKNYQEPLKFAPLFWYSFPYYLPAQRIFSRPIPTPSPLIFLHRIISAIFPSY